MVKEVACCCIYGQETFIGVASCVLSLQDALQQRCVSRGTFFIKYAAGYITTSPKTRSFQTLLAIYFTSVRFFLRNVCLENIWKGD